MSDLRISEPGSAEAMIRAFTEAPLNAAPHALRLAVGRLWMLHAHLFANPLPIAAAVGLWVRDRGLTEEDALKILDDMTHPEAMARFRFASDLVTDLAEQARAAISRREAERKRRTLAIEDAKAPLDEVRGAVGDLLKSWGK